jgi:geranylgeranyl reductase family protein
VRTQHQRADQEKDKKMRDVIVVGAGPSGLHAARRMAQNDLDVLVLERKQGVGKHVICTGIVSGEVFEEFEIPRDSIMKNMDQIKWISPYASTFIYKHHRPIAYIVDRKKFDSSISRKALDAGAEVEVGTNVSDIIVGKDGVEIITRANGTGRKKYSAKMVLIATGVNYNLHKKLGLGYPKDFLHGVQAEVEIGKVDCTQVYIGRDIAPGAFAWMVPTNNGHTRVGLMAEKDPRDCFNRLMKRYCPENKDSFDNGQVKFKAVAQGLVSKTYGERALVVGEAAGQVKTTTGGGISFGLLCSEIASKVIVKKINKGDLSASSLSEYEKKWKKAIQKEIVLGYYTRKICSKLKDHQVEKIFQFARKDGVIPLIREKGDFDWHSDLIVALLKRLPIFRFIKRPKKFMSKKLINCK